MLEGYVIMFQREKDKYGLKTEGLEEKKKKMRIRFWPDTQETFAPLHSYFGRRVHWAMWDYSNIAGNKSF